MSPAPTMPRSCPWSAVQNGPGRTLLTGATGFIGSHVMEAMAEAGLPVIAMARPSSDRTLARALKIEVREADLCDPASLSEAMQGCDCVIHTAALAGDWAPASSFHRVNVEGTLHVLEACRRSGVKHVVVTGSISSYGEENCAQRKDEGSGFNSHYRYFLDRVFPCALNHYRDSKAEATRAAMAYALAHHLNLTVLEPVWVYGEREFGTGFYAYVRAVQSGIRWMPGSARNTFHVVYARDLARAFVLAIQRPPPAVERIIVGNSQPESMRRIFDLFCSEAGLRPPGSVPKWAAYPAGLAMELTHSILRARRPPLLTRGRVNMFYDSIGFSTEKAERVLGFKSAYSLETGIRKTVRWYQANGFL